MTVIGDVTSRPDSTNLELIHLDKFTLRNRVLYNWQWLAFLGTLNTL